MPRTAIRARCCRRIGQGELGCLGRARSSFANEISRRRGQVCQGKHLRDGALIVWRRSDLQTLCDLLRPRNFACAAATIGTTSETTKTRGMGSEARRPFRDRSRARPMGSFSPMTKGSSTPTAYEANPYGRHERVRSITSARQRRAPPSCRTDLRADPNRRCRSSALLGALRWRTHRDRRARSVGRRVGRDPSSTPPHRSVSCRWFHSRRQSRPRRRHPQASAPGRKAPRSHRSLHRRPGQLHAAQVPARSAGASFASAKEVRSARDVPSRRSD